MYTWNIVSPRLGLTAKLTSDGRTMLRASYGRFSQGIFTGELSAVPSRCRRRSRRMATIQPLVITRVPSRSSIQDSTCCSIRRRARRAPTSTPSGSIARSAAGWRSRWLRPQGWCKLHRMDRRRRSISSRDADAARRPQHTCVRARKRPRRDRRFLLTNPEDYSLTLQRPGHGRREAPIRRLAGVCLVYALARLRTAGVQRRDRRRRASQHRRASATHRPSGAIRTISPTRAGLLPNDRPHIFRIMGSVDIPHTGLQVAANCNSSAASPGRQRRRSSLPQGDQRVLLEPRGTRRLSSQSLLDLRLSRPIRVGAVTRRSARGYPESCSTMQPRRPGHRQSVQHEFRPTDRVRGSAPRHDRRQIQSEPVSHWACGTHDV